MLETVKCKWRIKPMTSNMKLAITIVLTLSYFSVLADEPRYTNKFLSANKKVAFVLTETIKDSTLFNGKYYQSTNEFKWSVINNISKEKLYEIKTSAGHKSAFISNDGQFVVIINDWPDESPNDSLEMISIYNNGKPVKQFLLNEILEHTFNISNSVSHFTWTIDYPIVSFNSDEIKFTTFELNDFKIKISTGKIDKTRNNAISDTTILVYGEIISKNADIYDMQVCQKAFGPLKKSIIKFKSKKQYEKSRYYSILIDNGKEIVLTYKNIDIN